MFLFILAVALTRYVSLGSILVVLTFLVQLIVFGQLGIIALPAESRSEAYVLGAVFTLLALWKHRANIKRLLAGEENKFGMSKKEA